MSFFFSFIFFLIGSISYLYSYYLLFLCLLPLFYLFKYKKLKWKSLIYLIFTLFSLLLFFIIPKGKEDNINTYGLIFVSKSNYYLLLTLKGKYYVKNYDNNLPFLSIIKIQGTVDELSFSHYESGFDFKDYLKSKGIFYSLNKTKIEIIFKPLNFINKIQNYSQQYLSDDSKNLVSYLLFNQSISSYKSLDNLNLFSLFSISGIHITFLLNFIQKILSKRNKKIIEPIKIIILLIFLYLTSFKPSIIRILILTILSILNSKNKIKLDYLERISLCAILFLSINPYYLISQSFYYSFPFLFYLALTKTNDKNNNKFKMIFLLFSFSILLNCIQNGGYNPLSILSHIIILPLTHIVFVLSIFLLFIPHISFIINPLINLILKTADALDKASIFIITGKPTILFCIFFYTLFLLITILKIYSYKKESKIIKIILFFSIISLSINDPFYHYELNVIDIDQGLSTLIRYKNFNFLIDTGGLIKVDLATESLIPYLRKKKINQLDAVILTHDDYDHCGALESLNQNYKIINIYWQTSFLNEKDNSIYIGDLKIENLNDYNISSDSNSLSGVYKFEIRNKKILVMGDAPIAIEKKLLLDKKVKIKCDYLIIGHHGSKTSSSLEFLKATEAKQAFISCGENNKYDFPHKVVLDNLKEANIPYKRTDQDKTLSIKL